ncbi:ferritin family protein [Brevundimonas variabilis]|uniref:Rubrerythrin n=1 Tax=Brevundimonas variabilis TaxID=74312 RepID=A0A7W9FF98_9CAUL|nr:ferritin family protein [Brevundimonas variabilis]MBB5745199.1 rubrerythrin [Brevundimonas variabilis]
MITKSILATVLAALTLSAGAASAGELAPRTRANLEAAMHGEAFANLKYLRYAEVARESGKEELALLFESSANVEAAEHFAREADALGLGGTDEANLLDAMAGEQYESVTMYVDFAKEADADGDTCSAALFRQIASDEADHYERYREAADRLRGSR